MDDMELDGTPAQQPEDPFKGDSSVTAEQPAQAEQPQQTVYEEPVTAEAQPQPQPAAEAVAEEKPKWQVIIGKVAPILIAVTGILASLFMCLLSFQYVGYSMFGNKTTQSYMLTDVTNSIRDLAESITRYVEMNGSDASPVPVATETGGLLFLLTVMFAMIMGIITGIICGIMLIVKAIQQFAFKKKTTLEKTAITSCLFFFAEAAIVLSLSINYLKDGTDVSGTNQYGAATLAGLIICGILFAAYFVGKIAANYKMYLGDKTKLINGCMNLAWAVIAMLALALLTCAPVMAVKSGQSAGYGFNDVFRKAFTAILEVSDDPNADVSAESMLFLGSTAGIIVQIWFIFMCGKSLHGAMRGTIAADKAVKLGPQIWRLVFAVIYLIICASTSKTLFASGLTIMVAAPVVILIFSIAGLVLAIVNKGLVKEKAEKQDI